jgi:hypothetical protein
MDNKAKIKLLLAVLFSMGFMVFLLSRVEWEQFSLIAGRLDLKYLTVSLGAFLLGNLVRTFRFIHLDHTGKKLRHWWSINAFYNFITATLPGGAGEAATAYVLKRFSLFNMLGALRILLLSRLMDLFAISALLLYAAIRISSTTAYREAAVLISGSLAVISLAALIPASEQFVMKLLQKLPWRNALIRKVCEKLNGLIEIATERHSVWSFAITMIQSILNMLGGIMALHLLLLSFGIDITPVQSVYCYGIYAVFQIIPVQGIAGIGTQAAWWALALNASGYQGSDVIAVGILLHGTFYVFIGFIGLSAMLISLANKTAD